MLNVHYLLFSVCIHLFATLLYLLHFAKQHKIVRYILLNPIQF